MNTNTKICKLCNVEKPLSDFYIFSKTKKPKPSCKECMKVIDAKRHDLRRSKFNKKNRENWANKEYRDKQNQLARERWANNPEHYRQKKKKVKLEINLKRTILHQKQYKRIIITLL